jgi:hypothetical protein
MAKYSFDDVRSTYPGCIVEVFRDGGWHPEYVVSTGIDDHGHEKITLKGCLGVCYERFNYESIRPLTRQIGLVNLETRGLCHVVRKPSRQWRYSMHEANTHFSNAYTPERRAIPDLLIEDLVEDVGFMEAWLGIYPQHLDERAFAKAGGAIAVHHQLFVQPSRKVLNTVPSIIGKLPESGLVKDIEFLPGCENYKSVLKGNNVYHSQCIKKTAPSR